MKNKLPLALLILTLFVWVGCKPKSVEPAPTQAPDMAQIRTKIASAIKRADSAPAPQGVSDQNIDATKRKIALCEEAISKGGCDRRSLSMYYLYLGDLYYDAQRYEPAAQSFQDSLLERFDAFDQEKKQYDMFTEMNMAERQKLGEKPNLLAGAAYLGGYFHRLAFKDYAEMARAELRLEGALRKAGKETEADAAKERAKLGLDRTMEYLEKYEAHKRDLLGLVDKIEEGKESYQAHVKNWDSDLEVPRI